MFRKMMITSMTALTLACTSSLAWAHAHLLSATPAADTKVSASPSEIKLNYSEGVEAKLSQVTLAADGAAIALDKPETDPKDAKVLIVKVPSTLKPGTYKVTWHVVSVDTHKSQGSFDFTVAP